MEPNFALHCILFTVGRKEESAGFASPDMQSNRRGYHQQQTATKYRQTQQQEVGIFVEGQGRFAQTQLEWQQILDALRHVFEGEEPQPGRTLELELERKHEQQSSHSGDFEEQPLLQQPERHVPSHVAGHIREEDAGHGQQFGRGVLHAVQNRREDKSTVPGHVREQALDHAEPVDIHHGSIH